MLSSQNAKFQSTQWSLIAASHQADSQGRAAVEQLCTQYWPPVYAYIRRCGYQANDALDITQDIFSNILERGIFSLADPTKGKFRYYLLTATKNYLAEFQRSRRAIKRGGGVTVLSIDSMSAEQQFQPIAELPTPEQSFDYQWATQILNQTLEELDNLNRDPQRWTYYVRLKEYMSSSVADETYQSLATEFQVSVSAVRVQVHRLRKKFRELLRKRIASTLLEAAEIDEELKYLMQCLRR
jgi:RNA polymerase sigma-70 factor (ECF subfamily)